MIKHRYGDRYLHNGALEISFSELDLSEDLLLIGHFIFAGYLSPVSACGTGRKAVTRSIFIFLFVSSSVLYRVISPSTALAFYVPPGRSGISNPVPVYSGSCPESRNSAVSVLKGGTSSVESTTVGVYRQCKALPVVSSNHCNTMNRAHQQYMSE
ncbi:hypothetical protein T4E_4824 [Trichinella pseudospiralis]|uniref:Uncharacterized protein n=1 Tax=Trichinella pseudospiralis TaxID=6337 RepID=A0A0V0XHI9_TRIPS|nr:hypothetical protein T4E_4824 [Trichinella pseudospiralis]